MNTKNKRLFGSTRGEASMNTVYAVALTLIAVVSLVGLIAVNSQADDTAQSATISNATPTFSVAVTVANASGRSTSETGGYVNEAATTGVWVWGTASDNNGCDDIDASTNYTAEFYLQSYGSTSCTSDVSSPAQCRISTPSATYNTINGCTTDSTDLDTTVEFRADNGIPFYAVAGTWEGYIAVADSNAGATAVSTDAFTVATLNALNVTSSADYGTLALGATSTPQTTLTVTNTGNINMDYYLYSSSDFSCTYGALTKGQVAYSLTTLAVTGWASGTPVTATTSTAINASIAKQTTGDTATATSSLYTLLKIPSTGVGGLCSNTLSFDAKVDA